MSSRRPGQPSPLGRAFIAAFLVVWGIGFGAGGVIALTQAGGDLGEILFAMPFLLGGAGAILAAVFIALGRWPSRRRADRRLAAAMAEAAPPGRRLLLGDALDHQTLPSGPRTLTAPGRSGCVLVFLVPFTIVWIALTAFLIHASGSDSGPPVFFGWVFGAFAVALVAATGRAILMLTNPRATVELPAGALRFGEPIDLTWRLVGSTARLSGLRIELVGREEAVYTRGTNRYTDRSVFFRATLLEQEQLLAAADGTVRVLVDRGVPTFHARSNRVLWFLRFHAPIRRWPDVDDEIELPVGPPRTAPGGDA